MIVIRQSLRVIKISWLYFDHLHFFACTLYNTPSILNPKNLEKSSNEMLQRVSFVGEPAGQMGEKGLDPIPG